ncbi:MAG: penicillin acylase family protein, partial [Dehalococcoidales bacterium]
MTPQRTVTAQSEKLKRRGLPKVNGRLRAAGLEKSVAVIRDRWGCPHVNARTEHDVWFAQGFCHGQDRLWQLERTRRFARGTLSEILGEALIPIDRRYRRLGIRRVSDRDWPQLDDAARGILQAFSDGVNAAIDSMRQLPPEFEVLGYQPEAWSPTDSIALWKVIILTQTADFNSKLLRAAIGRELGADAAALLEPDVHEESPVVCPPGSTGRGLGAELARLSAEAHELAPFSAPDGGSNNWAVDGSLSASGRPLLAGDPHAVIQTAPVWYMNHLKTPEWEMTGPSTPGVPGILLYGHNGHVGWTVTNAFADVADLFVERFDESGRRYFYRGHWVDAEIRREEIHVKGRSEPVVEEIPVTVHGPLVSGGPLSASGPLGPGPALSWQWTGHQVVSTFECIPAMARARNVDEFNESQRNWAAPVMNRITADDSGNIAYQLVGDVPIRAHGGANAVPAPGWTGEYDWIGHIPFEELPASRNPERHFVVTANNRVVPAGYPYHVNVPAVTYRAWRIEQLLAEKPSFTLDDFKAIQADRYSLPAAHLIGLLAGMKTPPPETAAPLAMLTAWDCVLTSEAPASALYEIFMQKLFERVFSFVADLPGAALGLGGWIASFLPKLLGLIEADDRALLELNPATRGASWRTVLAETLAEAWQALVARQGAEPSAWNWGKLHRQTFVHNLGRTPPHDVTFNIPAVEIGGDGNTVFAAGAVYRKDFECAVGVSFRMLVDFADLDSALWVLPPG